MRNFREIFFREMAIEMQNFTSEFGKNAASTINFERFQRDKTFKNLILKFFPILCIIFFKYFSKYSLRGNNQIYIKITIVIQYILYKEWKIIRGMFDQNISGCIIYYYTCHYHIIKHKNYSKERQGDELWKSEATRLSYLAQGLFPGIRKNSTPK